MLELSESENLAGLILTSSEIPFLIAVIACRKNENPAFGLVLFFFLSDMLDNSESRDEVSAMLILHFLFL